MSKIPVDYNLSETEKLLKKMMELPLNQAHVNKGKKGRAKGSKNYTSTPYGTQINEYGFEFTREERESWRQAVNRLKRKQKTFTNQKGDVKFKELVLKFYQPNQGLRGNYSTSMTQFRDREDFEKSLERVNKYTKADYIERDVKHHVMENYAKMIELTGMYKAKDMAEYVRNMDYKEFMERTVDFLGEDFAYMNSSLQDEDDEYMQKLVHRIGYGENGFVKTEDGTYKDRKLIEKEQLIEKTIKRKSSKTPKTKKG